MSEGSDSGGAGVLDAALARLRAIRAGLGDRDSEDDLASHAFSLASAAIRAKRSQRHLDATSWFVQPR